MDSKLFVYLDNPSSTFRPGELIRGSVFLNNNSEVKQLTLTFHGEGNVLWRDIKSGHLAQEEYNQRHGLVQPNSQNRVHPSSSSMYHVKQHIASAKIDGGTETEVDVDPNNGDVHRLVLEFRNQETYMHIIVPINLLVPGETSLTEEDGIPFTFQLPTNLPSSCELTHGSVKYFVEANVTYKIADVDKEEATREPFHIIGCSTFPLINGALSTVVDSREQFYGILSCCKQGGEFRLQLSLGRSGYVAGEKINFELNYKNGSGLTFKKFAADLIQTITYLADGKKKMTEDNQISEVVHLTKIFPGDKGACMGQVPIPTGTLLTDLGGCRIIRVRYIFRVTTSGSCGREAAIETPIEIGARPPHKMMGVIYEQHKKRD